MKNALSFAVLATACMAMSSAHAESGALNANPKMYAEIGYTSVTAVEKDDGDKWKASPSMITGVFGYQPHPNIAIEGLLGFGAGKGKIKLNGEGTGDNLKLGTMYGVFVRPSATIGDVEVFGRVGWAHHDLKTTEGGKSSDGSMAYGLGARYHLNKSAYLQASWNSFYKKRDVKMEGVGLAYGMRF